MRKYRQSRRGETTASFRWAGQRSDCCPSRRKDSGSKAGRVLQLIEPVKAHRLGDAVADDDQPRLALVAAEMLVDGEGRDVDEVAALPLEALGLRRPVPFEGFDAIEFQVPVKVVA